ncbi:MAG: DUF3552 domain-containing protein [Candidatus Marinimicrobia bacterium]|nr:DUF3552 domain-containing protein [Candidatus Neomarinimicrobiota bacterium]
MIGYIEISVIIAAVAVVTASIVWAITRTKGANYGGGKAVRKGYKSDNRKNRGNGTGDQSKWIQRKEREINKKEKNLSERQRVIKQQERILAEKEAELNNLISEETNKLSSISGLSKDKARKNLMKNLERQLESEMRELKERIEENARETVNKEVVGLIEESLKKHSEGSGKEIIFSVYMLPRAEIKSWVIGSSGRNIRTFESSTGAKLVISQFSDSVIISSSDRNKVKMAEVALEELITFGKITPELIMDKVAHLKDEFVEFFDEER